MIENFKVSIVVPAYNEGENIPHLLKALKEVLSVYPRYEILIVNDGSRDSTLEAVKQAAKEDSHIKYISFVRNCGHQAALRAGLDHASGDCVISMDADMQHPPEMIPKMIELWQQGNDIVYTIRTKSKNITLFKKMTSSLFYALFRLLSGTNVPSGAADFRLMSRPVIESLKTYKESDLFLRGLVFKLGYKMAPISYVANERLYGETHYTFKKMFKLALSGIFSYTTRPLEIMSCFGFVCAGISCFMALCTLFSLFFSSINIASVILLMSVLFIAAVQFLFMGIIGQYLSIIFWEIKKRPAYLIAEQNVEGEHHENS